MLAPSASSPIFLHAMWRTGSSYLLSRFEANDRYLVFYEPWNGEIGSQTLRRAAEAHAAARRASLRHPSSDRSYFAVYDEIDPGSGRPLWSFAKPRLPLFDVYNDLSEAGARLLEACMRLAAVRGRTPVFGFCHSGLQVQAMRARFGGAHLHLSRPYLDQFHSYGPGKNDFFVPATVMQLLASRDFQAAAVELAPALARYSGPLTRTLIRNVPHRLTMRAARRIARPIELSTMFLLFRLAWQISDEHGRRHCDRTTSLKSMQENREERCWLESEFDIHLDQLSYPKSRTDAGPIDVATLEDQVERILNRQAGRTLHHA